ncbi:FAD-dependent oxidoreductase [Roseomonas sp. E05]|uniref:NAD(P)/FAD-dependent oxidoreductase n=1 Tax=Roseomonas sp. E05 TaxID=3046310 RepID=UPI0024BA44D7|nr:FAD-dependent oxidoreductase [Roseomonas sp. E05]MDJ0389176.1 FAD-dependent oxidoreductase [Roseomonas sp. E05]
MDAERTRAEPPDTPRKGQGLRHVIVGAGLAGHRAAVELRRLDTTAQVTLLGAEPGLPYDRPPLSKEFLLGQIRPEALVLKEAADYAALGIAHHPATQVVEIDRAAQRVTAGDGRHFPYDRLLLATGSRPCGLPAALAEGEAVHLLRSLADAERLGAALTQARHVAVVGGGFIGLEVAAAARMRGCAVTVVEAAPRLLARGMPAALADWVAALHRAEGVELRLGACVEALTGGGAAGAVSLGFAGGALQADLAVVGIGIRPNVELAMTAGLPVQDGILVDEACRTADPLIFAAGEVTCHPVPALGRRLRVESWRTASEQPLTAARAMCGLPARYVELPWLWSDQFGCNIQSIGLPDAGVELVARGDVTTRKWTLVALDEAGRPVGAVAVNNGRDIGMLRQAIRAGQPVPRALLADPAARIPVAHRAEAASG